MTKLGVLANLGMVRSVVLIMMLKIQPESSSIMFKILGLSSASTGCFARIPSENTLAGSCTPSCMAKRRKTNTKLYKVGPWFFDEIPNVCL